MVALLVAGDWGAAAWVASAGQRSASTTQAALQVGVLLPLALLALVDATRRLGGRALGAFAGLVWIALPLVGYHFFDFRMRPALLADFLPQAYGLGNGSAFAATAALALASSFLVRAVQDARPRQGAAAGLAATAALVLSPATLLFLPGALVALGLRLRVRALGMFAAAAVPGLVVALAWRWSASSPVFHWDYGQFHANLMGFREYFWSLRVVEWLPIAGGLALSRVSVPLGFGVSAWFWTTVLLRGATANTFSTQDPLHPSSHFLWLLLPALPAFALLVGSIPLLVPRLPARLARGVTAS